jgi:hypothetical protein
VVACGWEPLGTLLLEPNLPDLIRAYWAELSPHKGKLIPLPDWERMAEMEAAGAFKVWACRVDGTVAGFIAWQFSTHLAYKSTLLAIDCGHYLGNAWRDSGRIGYKMWRECKKALRIEGAVFAMLHDNGDRPLMPFFLALGAEPRSTIFWWSLTDEI